MHCEKCKQKAELKVFSTFQYWYCTECKLEVKEDHGNTELDIENHTELEIEYYINGQRVDKTTYDNCDTDSIFVISAR